MINLTNEYAINSLADQRLHRIPRSNVYKFNLNKRDIFIKDLPNIRQLHADLIAMKMLEILAIPTPRVDIGIIDDEHFLISYASYIKSEDFILGNQLFEMFYEANKDFVDANPDIYGISNENRTFERFNFLYAIWHAIEWYLKKENIYNTNTADLMKDLINQFLIYCISGVKDFHSKNWGLLHQENQLRIYPLIEMNLFKYFDSEIASFYAAESNMGIHSSDKHLNPNELLTIFLDESESEYLFKLINMVETLLLFGIEGIVRSVESENNITITDKEEFIKNFTNRLNEVKELFNNINNKRKRR